MKTMISRLGRTAVQLSYTNSARTPWDRVETLFVRFGRVAASYSTDSGFRSAALRDQSSCVNHNTNRTFATRPVSRPKGHTGRITSSPRKNTRTIAKDTAPAEGDIAEASTNTIAKPNVKRKLKAAAKPKAKSKTAKPKLKAKITRKPKAKKPKTPEQISAAAEREKKEQISALRKTALKPPPTKPSSAHLVVVTEFTGKGQRTDMSKAILRYKALRPEELEHYNHIANENKVANAAALRAWIESHSPEEIRKANKARVHLKRLGVKGFRNKLQDGRQVKRSIGCYGIFVKERFGSGDFMHIKFPDATKLIAAEWKTLSDAEKERYHAIAKLDRTRYTQEKKTVYNLDTKSSIAPQAAAAV